jgi:hypothetical protein
VPSAASLNVDYLLGGIGAGLVAAALVLLRFRRPQPALAAGVIGASLVALHLGERGGGVSVAASIAVLSCLLPKRLQPAGLLAAVMLLAFDPPFAMPIGLLLALSVAVVATAYGARTVSGWLTTGDTSAEGTLPSRVPPLAVFITIAGVWLAVPDTEAPLVVLGAALPLVGLALVLGAPGLTAVPLALWGAIAIDVFGWGAWGARGRPAALVGALACAGILLLVPLLRPLLERGRGAVALLGVHAITVLLAARWASRTDDIWLGVARSALVLTAAAVALAMVSGRAWRAPAPRSR